MFICVCVACVTHTARSHIKIIFENTKIIFENIKIIFENIKIILENIKIIFETHIARSRMRGRC